MTNPSLARPAIVGVAALRDRLEKGTGCRVLDIRMPQEFEEAHIPGAYNVPLDTLREHSDEITHQLDQDVVLVCRSGQRAAEAERTLVAAGLRQVHLLDGGMLAWQRAAGPLVRGRKRWELERQIRLVAGVLILAGAFGSLLVPALLGVAIFVGAGLTFAAISNTCVMGVALSRLPYNRDTPAYDANTVVAQLAAGRAVWGEQAA